MKKKSLLYNEESNQGKDIKQVIYLLQHRRSYSLQTPTLQQGPITMI